jgi:hypothetical protein
LAEGVPPNEQELTEVYAEDDGDQVCYVMNTTACEAANARLIAAAPEMLAALRLAADALDLAQAQVDSENDRDNLCKRLVAVKRVIAKAEGRK